MVERIRDQLAADLDEARGDGVLDEQDLEAVRSQAALDKDAEEAVSNEQKINLKTVL